MDLTLKPTIPVEYKGRSSKLGLWLLLALTPFWAVWLPWVAFWLAKIIITGAIGGYFDFTMIFLLFGFLGLIGVSIFSVFVCLQNKFKISADGVKFPLRCLFELRWRLFRPWSEMVQITFADSSQDRASSFWSSHEPDTMVVTFSDGGRLLLELEAFKREDLQSFLLALQSYVPHLPMHPPLSELRLGTSASNTAEKALSFTQIWEDDMASRFGSTVFIPIEPGETLKDGSLEILGQIAFGGLSAVYLAKDKQKQLCVIKEAVIPSSAEQALRDKAMEMFQREAQILMTLNHQRIAAVQDCFVENGRHYLLLEHIDGTDLRKVIKERGPQKEAMVLRWAAEVAELLDYLHRRNPPIVHRDLTPDNLVLTADGSITLIDFGAANQFLGTATGTLVGKQSYISPEQFRGRATPQSDLYSLGATMHFLLTAQDPEALSASHPQQVVAEVSDQLDQFVNELTALDTKDRIKTAAEAMESCRRLLLEMHQNSKSGVRL